MSAKTSYEGPATLLVPTGQRLAVAAFLYAIDLQDGGLASWGGSVRGEPFKLDAAFGTDGVLVELPDGAKAALILTSYDDDHAEVQGSGPPPF